MVALSGCKPQQDHLIQSVLPDVGNACTSLCHMIGKSCLRTRRTGLLDVKNGLHDADGNTFFADADQWENENIVQTDVNIQACQNAGKKIRVDLMQVNRKADKRGCIQCANVEMDPVGLRVRFIFCGRFADDDDE